MKKILFFSLLALFLFSLTANIAFAGTKAGSTELGLNASITNLSIDSDDDDDEDIQMFLGTVTAGYFITDQIQLGGSFMGNRMDYGDSDSTTYDLSAQAKYHFSSSDQTIVPYVGIQGGYYTRTYDSGDGDESESDGYSYGALGGLKFFVTESTTLNLELNYNRLSLDPDSNDDNDDNIEADLLALLIGFSIYF